MKPRTAQERWLEIAEAYGTPLRERDYDQYALTLCGLCAASFKVGLHLDSMGDYMNNRSAYAGVYQTPKMDELRCLMACWFATMTDKERREVVDDGSDDIFVEALR